MSKLTPEQIDKIIQVLADDEIIFVGGSEIIIKKNGNFCLNEVTIDYIWEKLRDIEFD